MKYTCVKRPCTRHIRGDKELLKVHRERRTLKAESKMTREKVRISEKSECTSKNK